MKKIMTFIAVVAIISVALAGCSPSKTVNVEFDFVASDILSVEVYAYKNIKDAQTKLVTKPEDINEIVGLLTSIQCEENKDDEISEVKPVTSFRFNLSNGSTYEVIYIGLGIKNSILKPSYHFNYRTIADLGGIWESLDYPVEKADASMLPTYEK